MKSLTELYEDFRRERGSEGRPISHRQAAVLAGDPGKYETFRKIATNKHSGRIDEDTVRALVRMGLNEREVRRAAGLQLESPIGPFQLPLRADRLTLPQREVVVGVVDAILAAYEQGRAATPEPPDAAPMTSPTPIGRRRAEVAMDATLDDIEGTTPTGVDPPPSGGRRPPGPRRGRGGGR